MPFHQSVEVLKNYFALLFPTRFYTEGIPGTIIDAYSAGVPVISSMWESFSDMIEVDVTGFGYIFGDLDGPKKILLDIVSMPEIINNIKKSCIRRAVEYTPQSVIARLVDKLAYICL